MKRAACLSAAPAQTVAHSMPDSSWWQAHDFNLPVWRPDLLKDTSLDQLFEGLRSGPRLDLLI
jgi:hypothetical protein